LKKYAKITGKLLKKGEPDIETVSKMIINDWMRGKIPYFVAPPNLDKEEEKKMIKQIIKLKYPIKMFNQLE